VQCRVNRRTERNRKNSNKNSSGSGSISGAALAHKMSTEKAPLLTYTPPAPTPKETITPESSRPPPSATGSILVTNSLNLN
ncbi:hypothetical protein PFISCL1PPCAC_7298, partial [Pristionchus fissidentatus]